MYFNKYKKIAKEYYGTLESIYDFGKNLFENSPAFKNILKQNNRFEYELLVILLFYTVQKIQMISSDKSTSRKILDLIHDRYFEDLKERLSCNFDERQQASLALNKRYSEYSNILDKDNAVMNISTHFIAKAFLEQNNYQKDIEIILIVTQSLVETIKVLEKSMGLIKQQYKL